MLVLADTDGLRIDLDQFRQRIHQPASDGDGPTDGDIIIGKLVTGRFGGRVDGSTLFADNKDLHGTVELLVRDEVFRFGWQFRYRWRWPLSCKLQSFCGVSKPLQFFCLPAGEDRCFHCVRDCLVHRGRPPYNRYESRDRYPLPVFVPRVGQEAVGVGFRQRPGSLRHRPVLLLREANSVSMEGFSRRR